MDSYPFLVELKDSHLRQLYKEVRAELKKRNMITYDQSTQAEDVVGFHNRPVIHNRTTKKSKGVIIANRNNDMAGQYGNRLKCLNTNSILIDFLMEDWSFLFPSADANERKYYVYYHSDISSDHVTYSRMPDPCGTTVKFTGMPFYIGKGTGDRYKSLNGRSTSHINRIKVHTQKGYDIESVCHILQDGLTEVEALELESKLICFFGCQSEFPTNRMHFHGKCGGALINGDVGSRPNWIKEIMGKRLSETKSKRKKRAKSAVLVVDALISQ